MTLSIDGHPGVVSRRVTYLSASSRTRAGSASKPKRRNDPWACQTEGQIADLKRRIPVLKRLIAACDRLAADLDREVRNEEDRVKIYDPAHSAYSTYARATASRRDNLRRSAAELRAHFAKAEQALFQGTKDGSRVDRTLFAGSNLDKAREIFNSAIKHAAEGQQDVAEVVDRAADRAAISTVVEAFGRVRTRRAGLRSCDGAKVKEGGLLHERRSR